jgi:hypothetical protein
MTRLHARHGIGCGRHGAAALAATLLVASAQAADPPAPPAAERMDLDPTAIRGNQELPKVLYIVPWKDPGLGEPDGRPLGSLIDEALEPVDREVFRRQMRYYDQLYSRRRDPGAGAPAPTDD